jgi:hypothetical protein
MWIRVHIVSLCKSAIDTPTCRRLLHASVYFHREMACDLYTESGSNIARKTPVEMYLSSKTGTYIFHYLQRESSQKMTN